MKLQLISSTLFLVGTLNITPAFAQKFNPGLWEAKSKISVNGIPLPSSVDEECVNKETAQNLKTYLTKELQKKGCKLEKWELKGQNLLAKLSCDKDDLRATGELKGKVTAKTYELSGDAEGSFKGIPSVASLNLSGQWKKSCQN